MCFCFQMSQARWIRLVLGAHLAVYRPVRVVRTRTVVVQVCRAALVIPATAKQVSFNYLLLLILVLHTTYSTELKCDTTLSNHTHLV